MENKHKNVLTSYKGIAKGFIMEKKKRSLCILVKKSLKEIMILHDC